MHTSKIPFINSDLTKVLLALIFLLGLAIRLYRLDFQSLWLDEYYIANVARHLQFPFLHGFNMMPPLYLVFLKIWLIFFPFSETSLRLPSAVIGSLSIPVLYFIGKELFNKKIALLASFFLAISAIHIDYSQEARYYPLALFLGLLMQLEYIRFLKYRRLKDFVWYATFSTLALYSYYYLALLLLIHIIHIVFNFKTYKTAIRPILFAQIISIALFSPCLLHIFHNPSILAQGYVWIKKPTPLSLIASTIEMIGGQWTWECGTIIFTQCFIFLILTFILLWFLRRQIHLSGPFFLALLWLIVPATFFYIFSFIFFPINTTRYLLISVFAMHLFFAWLVCQDTPTTDREEEKTNQRIIILTSVIIMCALASWGAYLSVGHQLSGTTIQNKFPSFLSTMLQGPPYIYRPIGSYFNKIDKIFYSLLVLATLLAVLIIPARFRKSVLGVFLVFMYCAINLYSLLFYFHHPVRAQFREATDFISRYFKKDEKILVVGYGPEGDLFRYYLAKHGLQNIVVAEMKKENLALQEYDWIIDICCGRMPHTERLFLTQRFFRINVFRNTPLPHGANQ